MKHCGTQTLETKRLILRRFTVRDADAMYTNWASDPEVTRYLTWPAHAGVETSRAVLADWTAAYAQESCYQWAIVLKDHRGGTDRLLPGKTLVASGDHVRGPRGGDGFLLRHGGL